MVGAVKSRSLQMRFLQIEKLLRSQKENGNTRIALGKTF